MLFPIVIHHESGCAYGVTIPDIPGCFTAGETIEEAAANVQEAVECHLEEEEFLPSPGTVEEHRRNPDYEGGVWMLVDIDLSCLGMRE